MKSLESQIAWYARAQWILGAAIVGGLLGFYLLGYLPATRRMAALQDRIQRTRMELSEAHGKSRNLSDLRRRLHHLEAMVQMYDRQFPRQAQIPEFIRDVTQISQQLALGQCKYTPGAPKRTDAYFELPIVMQFQGDFMSAASFLRQVEDLQRLCRVRRLLIRGKPNAAPGTVDVELAMSIYFSEG